MNRLKNYFHEMFLNKDYDLRIRLINLLAIAGILNSIIVCITSLFISKGQVLALYDGLSGVLGILIMILFTRTKRYMVAYIGAIFIIFIFFFTLIFFNSGGYRSGMPCFFILAVMLTVFMVDGKKVLFLVIAELLYYSGLCLFAYYHPEYITFFATEKEVVYDTIVGIVVVSVILAFTMYCQIRQYYRQQEKLEQERKNADAQRKAAEDSRKEAEKANEAKSIFLANMSHEIRTPINVMLGMNEMVLHEENSPRISEYARKIQSAGELLTSLVNNVLDISKIESGKIELVAEDYEVKSLIQELYLVGSERTQKKGLEFKIEIDPLLPTRLHGDLLHIKQIALNFISNAVKYTQTGSITLSLKLESKQDSLISLYLAVSDTGVGISKEDLDVIFEAFTRADLLKNRNIEGTGLGLSIAKKLSEAMGGTIHADSEYGKGSTFSVILPQQIVEENGIGQFSLEWMLTKKEEAYSFIAPGGKILVVDDNRENLAVMKALLSQFQLEIDTVEDGISAVEYVKLNEYHVIFMDYMMPKLDGIQTLHRMQQEIPTFQTPVIVLTADAIAGTKQKLLQSGFHAYLSKPVTGQGLAKALLTVLPKSLVLLHNSSNSNHPKEVFYDRLQGTMASYDLILDDALKLYQNDFEQYIRIAEFFLQYYEENRAAMEKFLVNKDMDGLKYQIHSLKSKARAVGASELYNFALGLEERCKHKDKEFVAKAMPVLFFEWERVVKGLNWMIVRCKEEEKECQKKDSNKIGMKVSDTEDKRSRDGNATGMSERRKDICMEECLKFIEQYQSREALEKLNELILAEHDLKVKEKLLTVKKFVENLDYEEAQRCLLK